METTQLKSPWLYKDKENAWLFGVCAGLADKFDVQPGGIRLICVAALFFTAGLALFAYVGLALLLKDKPMEEGDAGESPAKRLGVAAEQISQLERRLRKIENYLISDRFAFRRQLKG